MAVLDLATIITSLKQKFCKYILLLVLFYISMLTFSIYLSYIYIYLCIYSFIYLLFRYIIFIFLRCFLSSDFSLIWSFFVDMCMCESDHRRRPPCGA